MRIAYLECFSGMSGDMFLGALVDAGVPARVLEEAVAALGVGARLEISRVVRSGISASKVDVWVDGEKDLPREEYWAKQGTAHSHSHEHHEHRHRSDGEKSGLGARSTAGGTPALPNDRELRAEPALSLSKGVPAPHSHGRGISEICGIIQKAAISETAKKTAIRIFEALGAAEAKFHNMSVEQVHFHEVGAVDAMVDTVCAAVGAETLGVDEIVCSPLNL